MTMALTAAKRQLRVSRTGIRRQLADMRRLYDMSLRLSSHVELQTLLQEVLTGVCQLQRAPKGILMLYDAERNDLHTVASVGFSAAYLAQLGRVALGAGPCGRAVATRTTVMVDDVGRAGGAAIDRTLARLGGYKAVCCIPLQSRTGQMVGAIATCFPRPHKPAPHEMQLVALYGGQASEFIENARHFQQLRDASRMKDEFLATLSHEIRTPLNAVLGWANLLRSGSANSTATTSRAIEAIERNARIQSQLVEDLLDISRIVTGQMRVHLAPVDLAAVVDAALDTVRPAAANKRIDLSVDLAPDVVVFGDADRLRQVVWNLAVNAVKFTPEGGRVSVRVQPVKDGARIIVSDTGAGIAPDVLPHVFDRFRQGEPRNDAAQRGLGLGLAIVRHLVEAHGGAVQAESEGGGLGATFTVQLPRPSAAAAARPQAVQPPPAAIDVLRRRRILVVEDQADARELLSSALQHHGAHVMAVISAEEGLAALSAGAYDAIVADIGMPGMNGYALMRELRARDATRGGHTPAVALTVYASAAEREEALAAGFDDHLAKPADAQAVVAVLDRLIRRAAAVSDSTSS
jgi:signal transduction histidine kinase/ActR/RegA family two-component response regulator